MINYYMCSLESKPLKDYASESLKTLSHCTLNHRQQEAGRPPVCWGLGPGAQEGAVRQVRAAAGLQQPVPFHHPGVQHLLYHRHSASGWQLASPPHHWGHTS